MRGGEIADELLVRELKNDKRSPEAHALALSLVSPDNKFLSAKRLKKYLKSPNKSLRLEAIRTLAQQSKPERFELLAAISAAESQPVAVRAEAIVGLSAAAGDHKELLDALASDDDSILKHEAGRALRLAGLRPGASESKPPADDLKAWDRLLSKPGDAESGRRVFFSPVAARCSVCHQHSGRGGRIGPDLTDIAGNMTRERIIESILQPSREIAPHYQPWILVTEDGKPYTGLRLPQAGDNGKENYFDSSGKVFTLASEAIEERHTATTSIMPDNLQDTLSVEDLRDLVTFLRQRHEMRANLFSPAAVRP
jgi:putative heme-binding domain-containing protein